MRTLKFNWLARGNLGADAVLIGKAGNEEKTKPQGIGQWWERRPRARQVGRLSCVAHVTPRGSPKGSTPSGGPGEARSGGLRCVKRYSGGVQARS